MTKLTNRTVVICDTCDADDSVEGDEFDNLKIRGWVITDEEGDLCPDHALDTADEYWCPDCEALFIASDSTERLIICPDCGAEGNIPEPEGEL